MTHHANGSASAPPRGTTEVGRRLKIAFVYDALFPYQTGGAERRFYEIARRLADRHDVHFVTWRHWGGPTRIHDGGMTFHGVGPAPKFYGRDGKRTVSEALRFTGRLGPVLLRERFDVVDCSATPYLPLYTVRMATRLRSTPLVATWHEFWDEHWLTYLDSRPLVARAARRIERSSVPLADQVVAVSDFTAGRLEEQFLLRPAPAVVENGISFEDIRRIPRTGPDVDVVYVGRLIEEKRVDVLLRAVGLLRTEWPEIRCEIIGDGPERGRLEALAAELRLGEAIAFRGIVDEETLFGRLKAATAFALPSVREGFGIAVIEAQACGTVPIVARAPNSAASLLVEHNRTGLTCDPEPAAFAAALGTLIADPRKNAELAEGALAAARERDWEYAAGGMEHIYQGLSARHRRSQRVQGRNVGRARVH